MSAESLTLTQDVVIWDTIERIPHPKVREFARLSMRLKGETPVLRRADIDPAVFKAFLPNMVIFEVVGEEPRYRMRLMGTGAGELTGTDLTGQYLDEIFPPDLYPFAKVEYADVVTNAVLRYRVGPLALRRELGIIFHRLLLPLSRDGSEIDMILSVVYETPRVPVAPQQEDRQSAHTNPSDAQFSRFDHDVPHHIRQGYIAARIICDDNYQAMD